MDIERIRNWAWSVANTLMKAEGGEPRSLNRFMMDLRNANLPHEFSNAIANNMTVFQRAGIDVGEIPLELQYFSNITSFKEAKAVIIATFHNVQVAWSRVITALKKGDYDLINEKTIEEISSKYHVKQDFIKMIIDTLKGGEEG